MAQNNEREAVVRWLRENVSACDTLSARFRTQGSMIDGLEMDAIARMQEGIASAIERGDHLPTPTGDKQ